MNKRITIKDIAKELNVHHSTVSRALRNDPRVTDKTREKVLAFAHEHEYQTNMNAVNLRGADNKTIALIVPNINHSFFSDIVSRLTNLAFGKGFVISIFQSNESYIQEKQIVETIIKHNFAGVIVSISKETTVSDHFKLLKKFGIPLVFFDRICEDIIAPKVIVNNYDITAYATEYLFNKGYKRITHITGTNAINVFRDRQNGYLDKLKVLNVEYVNPIEILEDFTVEQGKDLFNQLWSLDKRPDAIISSSIHITLGILLQAKFYGIKIPSQLGIITFGSMLSAEINYSNITIIEQPEIEIAHSTFELLENLMNTKSVNQNEMIKIEAKILFRESC